MGQVVLAPPIGSDARGYNEDWVAIEVDASNFTANALHFCAPHFSNDFSMKMLDIMPKYTQSLKVCCCSIMFSPTRRSATRWSSASALLALASGALTFHLLAHWHASRGRCLIQISKHWPILSLERDLDDFAQKSDSGSAVANASGHIGGLITSGAGSADDTDIVYPAAFILNNTEANGLQPVLPKWPLDNRL